MDLQSENRQGRQLSKENLLILNHLYNFIEDVGEATIDEITKELFDKVTLQTKAKAHGYIMWLRRKLKKQNIFFYAVKHKHKFLTEDQYYQCSVENKKRWDGLTTNLQEMIKRGVATQPELQNDFKEMLGEMAFMLISGKQENTNKSDNEQDSPASSDK